MMILKKDFSLTDEEINEALNDMIIDDMGDVDYEETIRILISK
jgi:hypothetical protein